MAGWYRKIVNLRALGPSPATPGVIGVHALTPVSWHQCAYVMAAQDTICASARRVLARIGLLGSFEYPIDQTETLTPGVQNYPDATTWRTIWGPLPRRVAPGCYLEAHVLYQPSGNTQSGFDIVDSGAQGEVRIRVDWTNGASSTGTLDYTRTLPPSLIPDDTIGATAGQIGTAAGDEWASLEELVIENITPPGVEDDPAEAEVYSEWTTAEITIQIRGGARLVDLVLYERPLRHAQDHDDTTPKSVHAFTLGAGVPLSQQTHVPQIEARDAPVIEEHRFGTLQTLRVGAQQDARLGESMVAWSPWLSAEGIWTSPDRPLNLSGTLSFTDMLSGIVGYDPDGPGWRVSGAYSRRYDGNDAIIMPDGGRAVIPVRLTIDAAWTSGGGGTGTMRLQSSETEWIDVVMTGSTVRTTWTAIGWLESQVFADHDHAVLQMLYRTAHVGDEIDVYGFAVEFGW